jgi:hypothetical protein
MCGWRASIVLPTTTIEAARSPHSEWRFGMYSSGKTRPSDIFRLQSCSRDISRHFADVARSSGVDANHCWSAFPVTSSCGRFLRLVTVEKTVFLRRLRVLGAADLAAVRDTWNQHMTL